MPAKSTSPEAAQKRVWKAELKALVRDKHKLTNVVEPELLQLSKECRAASRALEAAKAKHNKLLAKLNKARVRELASIDRRIGILNGRIHN